MWIKRNSIHFGVITSYLLITLVFTYPLITVFTTHAIGLHFDTFQNIWNIWWVKKALLTHGCDVYFTPYLHHPTGITLIFQTLNPFNCYLALLLLPFFNLITVYNIIVVVSFVLTGYFMYLLVVYLTRHRAAAWLAGLCFAFCPFHTAHTLCHLQLVSMQFIPLYVLFLFRAFDTKLIRYRLLAALALVLTALCCWYYVAFLIIFTGCYLAYLWVRRLYPVISSLALIIPIMVLVLVALSPILAGMALALMRETFTGAHNPVLFSADLASFFIPGRHQTIGQIFQSTTEQIGPFIEETGNYLGYGILIPAVYAAVRLRRTNKYILFWAVSGGLFLILAMGTNPRFLGQSYMSLPLPYAFLYKKVFFFQFTGVPERFTIMLIFSLVIMAAFTVVHIIRRYGTRGGIFVFAMMTIVILMEFATVPMPVTKLPVSPYLERLASDTDEYAVMDLNGGSIALYHQTVHEKKLVGGFVTRSTKSAENFLRETPIISDILARRTVDGNTDSLKILTRRTLDTYNIRYILSPAWLDDDFLRHLGFDIVYKDGVLKVFQISDTTITPPAVTSIRNHVSLK